MTAANRGANTLIGWELRVDQSGELKRSELFRDRQALETRSNEWRDMLLEKGWTQVN